MGMKTAASALLACAVLMTAGTGPAHGEAAMTMENEYWRLRVEPEYGARASALHSLAHDRDFNLLWRPVTEGRDEGSVTGGAFAGRMSGSYLSAQPQEAYEVVSAAKTEAVFRYENKHLLLEGLHEEKTIRLEGPTALCRLEVTNRGREERIIYYRIQDWLGTGTSHGPESVYIVPWTDGPPYAFSPEPGEIMHRPFISPAGRWFALADLNGDAGLKVSVAGTEAAAFFFWGSADDPRSRTAEIFFPRVVLAPGETWSAEVRYTLFKPSAPGDTIAGEPSRRLTAGEIRAALEGRRQVGIRSGLPYGSAMGLPAEGEKLQVAPVHLIDDALEGAPFPEKARTLRSVRLHGTPGEAVPLVLGLRARADISGGRVVFSDFAGRRRRVPAAAVDSGYVAVGSGLLVKDWELARDIPMEVIGAINNEVSDARALTPFSLEAGAAAYVYSLVRIPERTAPGEYRGRVTFETGAGAQAVDVNLAVRPFRLLPAKHKTYGTFFRYFIRSGADSDSAGPHALSREEYLQALRSVAETGYNGLVIYVADREDLLWALEKCRELGMTGGFVLTRGHHHLTAEDVGGLKERQNIMGWGIDEPIRYHQIPVGVNRYRNFMRAGLFTPAFTPNVPVGLIMADHLPEIVPIIAMSGNLAYGMEATRRYRDEGRQVYWYRTGQARATIEQRLFRGVYLWKEPVDGILDWGDDSIHPPLGVHQTAGFAGTKVLPRLGRENIRQALIDLDYLHTLETLAAACPDPALKSRAEGMLGWIRGYFGDDWYLAMEPIQNPQFLDDLRGHVAEMAEALVRAGARPGPAPGTGNRR